MKCHIAISQYIDEYIDEYRHEDSSTADSSAPLLDAEQTHGATTERQKMNSSQQQPQQIDAATLEQFQQFQQFMAMQNGEAPAAEAAQPIAPPPPAYIATSRETGSGRQYVDVHYNGLKVAEMIASVATPEVIATIESDAIQPATTDGYGDSRRITFKRRFVAEIYPAEYGGRY